MARSQSFEEFVARLTSAPDSLTRLTLLQEYLSSRSVPVVVGQKVHFLYRGQGKVVAVPGEMNRWNPTDAKMERIPGTNLWFRTYTLPENARVEYKIWVDSTWSLDPFNARKARGGHGENSDLWMPSHVPPTTINFNPNILHGKIDTVWFESTILRRTHPVFIYMLPGLRSDERVPTVYVLDGGEYLSLAKMHTVLDNLIAEKAIQPVLGVFIDPRTELHDPAGSKRMSDYAASEQFLDFLEKELVPYVEKNFPAARSPRERLIMGASMGGLISTYAVLRRPDFVFNCAAQSPAYLQADSAVIKLIKKMKKPRGRIYIDTGTISDTRTEARLVKDQLEKKGLEVSYAELPEGHNWSNWRARLDDILKHFFPAR